MRATLRCAERSGVSGFSMEDVASESGLSRTSVYRHFPDGRSQLLEETATWEVARFWTGLAIGVAHLESLEDRLVEGLVVGAKRLKQSHIMANLMEPDVSELAGALEPARPLLHTLVRDYVAETLVLEADAGRLADGVDVDEAADYLTRMVLSTLTSPAGVDFTDPEQTRRVVRTQFLAGITAPDPG